MASLSLHRDRDGGESAEDSNQINLQAIEGPESRRRYAKEKVQVGNDQEKARSEKDSHSKNRGGKKLN